MIIKLTGSGGGRRKLNSWNCFAFTAPVWLKVAKDIYLSGCGFERVQLTAAKSRRDKRVIGGAEKCLK